MKIEEIKTLTLITTTVMNTKGYNVEVLRGDNDIHLDEIVGKINLLIKAHNEKEEDYNICTKCRTRLSYGKCPCNNPLSHFFKPESELIQSYIKEREILLKRLEYCFEYPMTEEGNIKTIQQRLQEIDKLILK